MLSETWEPGPSLLLTPWFPSIGKSRTPGASRAGGKYRFPCSRTDQREGGPPGALGGSVQLSCPWTMPSLPQGGSSPEGLLPAPHPS